MTSVDPRKVVLIGNFGAVNLGDEILLATVARWIADGGDVPVAISTSLEHTRSAHAIEPVFYGDPGAIVEAMADADLVVLAGGGLFQDYDELDPGALARFPAFGVTQFAQYVYLAQSLGVPCVALAQGVGPLRADGSRRIVADVFSRVEACSVRDRDSAALLKEVGAQATPLIAPDPGWAWHAGPLPAFSMPSELAGRNVLAVNVRDWPFEAGWEDALADVLARELPAEWGCLWIDFHIPNPAATVERDAAARRIMAAMASRGSGVAHALWTGNTAEEALAAIAACQGALTMRLHAALLALRAPVPTVTLEYDAKVAALANEAGMPEGQRVPIAGIAAHLPGALAQLTRRASTAFRMTKPALEKQELAALAHRELLHEALARIPGRERLHPHDAYSWLAAWWPGDDPAPRVVRALAHRMRRMSVRDEAARKALDHVVAQLHRVTAERDAQAHARATAEAARARSASELDAIVRSRSYRALAPLRRMSQWRARLASKARK